MSWLKKRGDDFIDLTEMQRKGILERARVKDRFSEREDRVVDLSFAKKQVSVSSNGSVNPSLGFLDNLAHAASSNNEDRGTSYGGFSENLQEARKTRLAEFNEMKLKLNDLEFKLGKLMEKIEKIENKMLGIG